MITSVFLVANSRGYCRSVSGASRSKIYELNRSIQTKKEEKKGLNREKKVKVRESARDQARLLAKEQSSSMSARKSRKVEKEAKLAMKKENGRGWREVGGRRIDRCPGNERNLHFVKLLFESLQTRLENAWRA